MKLLLSLFLMLTSTYAADVVNASAESEPTAEIIFQQKRVKDLHQKAVAMSKLIHLEGGEVLLVLNYSDELFASGNLIFDGKKLAGVNKLADGKLNVIKLSGVSSNQIIVSMCGVIAGTEHSRLSQEALHKIFDDVLNGYLVDHHGNILEMTKDRYSNCASLSGQI